MKYFLFILVTLILVNCSQKNVKKSTPGQSFTIKKTHQHSPWKTVNFMGYYTVKCPENWRVSRDKSRVFIRPKENEPVGVVIGMERDDKLNTLPISKYFVHFYKNLLIPRGIRVKNLEQTTLSGLRAVSFEYRFTNDFGQTLRGFEILVKHKGTFFYFVAEAPDKNFQSHFVKFKWIIDSAEFPGTVKRD